MSTDAMERGRRSYRTRFMITLHYRGQSYARSEAQPEQLTYDRSSFESRRREAKPAQDLTYRGLSYVVSTEAPTKPRGEFCYRGVTYTR